MLTRRNFLGGLGVAGVSALALAACDSADEDTDGADGATTDEASDSASEDGDDATEAVTVRIGNGYYLKYAYESGALDDILADVNVELEFYDFSSGPAQNESFAANALDFGYMNHFPAFTGATAYGTRILATCNATEVDGVLVATPASGIETIADLEGKTVGSYVGGSWHYCTSLYLESVGLTLDDIELINTTSETASSLRTESIDAGVIGVTTAYALVDEGTASIVADKTGKLTYSALCGHPDFIEAYPEVTTAVVKAFAAAFEYADADPEGYADFYEELTSTDTSITLETWDIYDRTATVPGPEELEASEDLLAWMQANDYANTGYVVDDLFDLSFAEAAGLTESA